MWRKLFLSVALLIILQHILTVVYIMGLHKRIYRHYPGPCRNVGDIDTGSEDIALLSNGLAFITSGVNPAHMGFDIDPKVSTNKGQIYLFDFNHPEKDVTKLKFSGKDFDVDKLNPHGISVYEDKETGTVTLFVVNHRKDKIEVIEIFQFDQQTLTLKHQKSVSDPEIMWSVNDVVAMSADNFYFTNDGYATSYFARNMEGLFMLARGNVIYYDGQKLQKVADKGHGCNGIAASPDNKFIYVAQPTHMSINVFERKADSSLHLVQVLNLGSSPDNIFVEPETGNLWVGCQPILHQLVEHFKNNTLRSASQVLHVKWEDNNVQRKYVLSEVFADTGELISGSTISAFYGGKLLIGTVMDKLAYCEVNAF